MCLYVSACYESVVCYFLHTYVCTSHALLLSRVIHATLPHVFHIRRPLYVLLPLYDIMLCNYYYRLL